MKKNILLILALQIAVSFIYGCAFEEQYVPDPKPAQKLNYTPIDENNSHTFIGKYMVNALKIANTNSMYTSYMDGYIQLKLSPNGSLEYNYDLLYNGYNNDSGYKTSEKDYTKLEQYQIKDNRTITLNTPIVFKDNKYTYTINSLQKYDNDILSFDNMTNVNNVFYKTPELCDPTIENGDESCASVNGALKYVGYYRIEKLTCNSNEYIGGQDFAGEMVATPSLNRLPNYVDLPLEIKVQIKTETLKQCFLKTEEQSKNIYLKNIEYKLKLDNDFKLENIFQQVGLLGLASKSNKNVRTTEIDFKPKNPNFTDMKFGNNNNEVLMRLKIIKQGMAGGIPVKKLDDIPYINY